MMKLFSKGGIRAVTLGWETSTDHPIKAAPITKPPMFSQSGNPIYPRCRTLPFYMTLDNSVLPAAETKTVY